MQMIFNSYDKFCWWLNETQNTNYFPFSAYNYESQSNLNEEFKWFAISDPKNEIKTRKRRNSVLEVDSQISNIHKCLRNGSLYLIWGRIKQRDQYYDGPRGRSSNYIGVSMNGDNWQVLINCGKFKKYIGTFANEKQAAIMYDFYSICLHLAKAKTNFTYDAQLIEEMVESYESKSKTFDALRFVDRV